MGSEQQQHGDPGLLLLAQEGFPWVASLAVLQVKPGSLRSSPQLWHLAHILLPGLFCFAPEGVVGALAP